MAHGVDSARAGAVLAIGLDAIRANYRLLRDTAAGTSGAACAAVMKADAYGLGMDVIAPALAAEGCRVFFTAHLEEGIRLRRLAPADAVIYVLHGLPPAGTPETALEFVRHDLIPVLNDPAQIAQWRRAGRTLRRRLPAALQFDTGMSRMGMAPPDVADLLADPAWRDEIAPVLVMSHLACADEPLHEINLLQRERFAALRAQFPGIPGSLANSSAVFLGPDYHHDLVRPGAALYGINPQPGAVNPLRQAVSLHARIVQSRTVQAGDAVGYGARYVASGPRRIATIAIGYADGWPRALSGRGQAFVDGVAVPIAGTVSMDSITLDVTGIPEERVLPGREVELLGEHQTVDEVARAAGTIGYEVLTRLGSRFHREYR
jgi:alanine racemase